MVTHHIIEKKYCAMKGIMWLRQSENTYLYYKFLLIYLQILISYQKNSITKMLYSLLSCDWSLFSVIGKIISWRKSNRTADDKVIQQITAWWYPNYWNLGLISPMILSITIEIRWKFHFALIQILMKWSLQNSAHDTAAELPCHVQKFVVIWWPVIQLQQYKLSIEFESL